MRRGMLVCSMGSWGKKQETEFFPGQRGAQLKVNDPQRLLVWTKGFDVISIPSHLILLKIKGRSGKS